jgi:hypothetical protein
MTDFYGLIVDGLLALLLVATITACFIVYKRLSTIKDGQAELQRLVRDLNAAAQQAQKGVAGLKASAEEVEGRLALERQKAVAMADELSLITESGNNLANRIEQGLTSRNSDVEAPKTEKTASKKQQQAILAALREAR